MNELFEALLDMTKLEAGIVQANQAEIAVQRLLDRIESTFADLADRKGLSLRVVPCSAWVRSDPILLERILFNLVGNAVRYTARGGVVVGCRHRATQLRIDVCDTGAGIPEDQCQSIFGEFYKLATPAPDRKAGLGLGLAIVDRLRSCSTNHSRVLRRRSRQRCWLPSSRFAARQVFSSSSTKSISCLISPTGSMSWSMARYRIRAKPPAYEATSELRTGFSE
jgi:light-regulated signal transduction histidine kinase (bacteriophytochrome)